MKLTDLRTQIAYLRVSTGFDSYKAWDIEHARDAKTSKRRNQWHKGTYRKPTVVTGKSIANLIESPVAQFRFEEISLPVDRFQSVEECKQWIREQFSDAEDGEYWIMFNKRNGMFARAFARWTIYGGVLDFISCSSKNWYGRVAKRQPLMYEIEEWGWKPYVRKSKPETFEGDIRRLDRRR